GQRQNVFYRRLTSPLNDRSSWIKSVADAVLGKPIEDILDEEEALLYNNIKDLALGLLKAVELNMFNSASTDEKLMAFRFFDESGEPLDNRFIIRKNNPAIYTETRSKLDELLKGVDASMRKTMLLELLSEELKALKEVN